MLKRVLFYISLVLLFSCEKTQVCPDILLGKPEAEILNTQELGKIESLFVYNNLKKDNLRFTSLFTDQFGNRHAGCYQYVNNLRVFSGDLIYHFGGTGKLYWLTGTYTDKIEISSIPSLQVEDLKKIYRKSIETDTHYSSSSESIFSGCVICELGYYDMNAGTAILTPSWCLSWSIHPYNTDYPKGIINDSNGFVIKYDNGINPLQQENRLYPPAR